MIDLDGGVVLRIKKPGQPMVSFELIRVFGKKWRSSSKRHYIILQDARHMKTAWHQRQVMDQSRQGYPGLAGQRKKIPYDEIYVGSIAILC